ncbi:hypothetical protein G6F68_016189 [Rhizopus microsporus]|nr:hypothetical protein G6F68_016189 [Rhizopus microsporus]
MDSSDAHALRHRAVLRLPDLAEPRRPRISQRAGQQLLRRGGGQFVHLGGARAQDGGDRALAEFRPCGCTVRQDPCSGGRATGVTF